MQKNITLMALISEAKSKLLPQKTLTEANDLIDEIYMLLADRRDDIVDAIKSADDKGATFINKYECVCGERWEDTWDCSCNDRCPSCNKEIEPYESVEV